MPLKSPVAKSTTSPSTIRSTVVPDSPVWPPPPMRTLTKSFVIVKASEVSSPVAGSPV